MEGVLVTAEKEMLVNASLVKMKAMLVKALLVWG